MNKKIKKKKNENFLLCQGFVKQFFMKKQNETKT